MYFAASLFNVYISSAFVVSHGCREFIYPAPQHYFRDIHDGQNHHTKLYPLFLRGLAKWSLGLNASKHEDEELLTILKLMIPITSGPQWGSESVISIHITIEGSAHETIKS
jgi:hypothetical protein